jgi:hypothetical protein
MTAFSATLDVDTVSHKGYWQANDRNNAPINYWYRFWGGDANNQGTITVSQSKDGDSTLVVRFDKKTDQRYQMDGVLFYSDKEKTKPLPWGPRDQFDFSIADDKRSVTICDRIRKYGRKGDCFHNILVLDTAGAHPKLEIVCDPTIHNVGIDNVP